MSFQFNLEDFTANEILTPEKLNSLIDALQELKTGLNERILAADGVTAKKAGNVTENINGKAISSIFETNGTTVKQATNATYAGKLGSSTVGSASNPIYLNYGTPTACTYTLGAACQKSVSDSTSASALSSTDTNVPTVRDIYYGLPKINGSHAYSSSNTFYAPTGYPYDNKILAGTGSDNPIWKSLQDVLYERCILTSTSNVVRLKTTSSESKLQILAGRAEPQGTTATNVVVNFDENKFGTTPTVVASYGADTNTEKYYSWIRNVTTTGFTCRGYGGYYIYWLAIGRGV